MSTQDSSSQWSIEASAASLRTSNPIRAIVDGLNIPKAPEDKPLIPLSIGDPTRFGNLPTPQSVRDAVANVVSGGTNEGYGPATGLVPAREAIAAKFSVNPEMQLTKDDVIITSGCSDALYMSFAALAQAGDNVLLPQPGFSLYETICARLGCEARFYKLQPEKSWEVDLAHMESLVDAKTKAILINSPSNPCGSVYSKQHLLAIIAVAEKHRLPIVADEIYANMVFKGHDFHHMASLTSEVPVLTVGGVSKQYLVPGWRVGWILIVDKHNRFTQIRDGLARLSTVILGANSMVQAALPSILNDTDPKFFSNLNQTLEEQALFCADRIKTIPGLKVVVPQGAMYLMVEIKLDYFSDAITSEKEFVQKLLDEEFVFVLPGSCFRMPSYFRIVTCPPKPKLAEACDRIQEFCKRHAK